MENAHKVLRGERMEIFVYLGVICHLGTVRTESEAGKENKLKIETKK